VSRLGRIAVREYLESVRTKAFLIGVLIAPAMFGLSLLVPVIVSKQETATRSLVVADATGRLGDAVVAALAAVEGGGGKPAYRVEAVDLGTGDAAAREARARETKPSLDARVKDGSLFGWVLILPSALERKGPPSEFWSGNLVDFAVQEHVRSAVKKASDDRIVADRAIPPEAARLLTARVPFDAESVKATSKAGSAAATMTPFVFSLILFLTIVSVSQALITSTLEEKGTRVVEVLLSSVSPFELMCGKILGTCAVGLTLMTIWSIGGIGALAANGLMGLVDPSLLLLCLAYYLLGFVLIASLMVAAGSACNTLKEAQNLVSPLMFLLTLPMLFWLAVAKDPHGTLAVTLSFIPLFTPFLMMMRVAGTTPPPPLEIAASLVVLALATWLALRLAARVFRVGVLLYGKPPSLREIVRWMRVKS
jgi:ABC-2 type transport system permease protein